MATKLGFKRFLAAILAVSTVAAAVPAAAGGWMPLLPDQDYYDFQLFAPPDLREYSLYPKLNHGIWFQYDRLWWSWTRPDHTVASEIGDTTVVNFQVDSFYTVADWTTGNRYEFGYLNEEELGLMASVYHVESEPQVRSGQTKARIIRPNPAPQQPGTGIPVEDVLDDYPFFNRQDTLLDASISQHAESSGVEVNLVRRVHRPTTRTGLTFLMGPRYMNFTDQFGWQQEGVIEQRILINPAYAGDIDVDENNDELFEVFEGNVDDFAEVRASNDLIGPQLGARIESAAGRWKFVGEFRAAPMANFQNVYFLSNQAFSNIDSSLGTGLGDGVGTIPEQNARFSAQVAGFNPVNTSRNYVMFSMLGEYRADVAWQMSKSVTLRLAYTGMVVSNMNRAASYLTVEPPTETPRLFTMQVENRWVHTMFMNGFNVGFEINR